MNRHIRVFISSTFRDMQEERDYLVKFIFPQLRKLCEERAVAWTEVDLRWGIPDEQKAEGKVLPICLEEIQRCRPYFIGLLGERYGWVPDEIPKEIIEREGWLGEHLHHSVTELEILYGVLNNTAMADHALFYFRDPAYGEKKPANERSQFLELPTDEEIAKYGEQEATRRTEERKQKLALLKQRIRASGLKLRENYSTPQAMGEMLLEDMKDIIERLYPKGSEPGPLDREAAEHEAFAHSRARVYIGRQEYFDRLDEHVQGDGQPLVVLGESGSGKSALLANWALRYRDSHPGELLLMHFIGATPYSADWAAMVRRIMGEFKRQLDIQHEIPDKPDELRLAFANWLHMAAAKRKIVIIIDALNQLEDREGALDLVWLPPFIPQNVRLILSTLPGRPLDELTRRELLVLQVRLLEVDERRQLIKDYLAQYSRALGTAQMDHLASSEQTANPLFLRVLLDELRVFGVHEKLNERIAHYVTATTIQGLYEKVLARWEQDYEGDTDMVGDALSLIWAARRGLSEAELVEMLGINGTPLPRAFWSPFYLAAEQSLVSRSGLLSFAHAYLREAVRDAYMPTEVHETRMHLRVAKYFEKGETIGRKVEELPWQLAAAKAWEKLSNLLANRLFLPAAWDAKEFEVKSYWAAIEANSALRMRDSYAVVLASPEKDASYSWLVGRLLGDTGHTNEALVIWSSLVEYCRRIDDPNLEGVLGEKAMILQSRGELDEAMGLLKEQERICRDLAIKDGLSGSLGNQAIILQHRGELEEAMHLLEERERISREWGDKQGLQATLGEKALILQSRGELDEAMRLHKEKERLCRELGNVHGLSISFGNQAVVLKNQGELDEAMQLLKEQERICRETGDKHVLSGSLGNQAGILMVRGELDEAVRLLTEQEQLCRELGNKHGMSASIGNQALILADRGELDEALQLLKEQERICRELADKNGLSTSLGNQAAILRDQGYWDEAMQLQKEKERLCRELGNKHGLSVSIGNQALILADRGELDAAMRLHYEEERLCHELGDKNGLLVTFGNQAAILIARGELDEAMRLLSETERLCRELGNKMGLIANLDRRAQILHRRGDLNAVLSILKEQEGLCRELGSKAGMQASLGHQAVVLRALGEVEEAMRMHKEEEHICRALGSKNGLQASLGNQALILKDRGELDEAMRLIKEQERICRELGLRDALATSLINQASLLAIKMGRPDEAFALAEEAYQIATHHGLVALSQQIRPILETVRSLTQQNPKHNESLARLDIEQKDDPDQKPEK